MPNLDEFCGHGVRLTVRCLKCVRDRELLTAGLPPPTELTPETLFGSGEQSAQGYPVIMNGDHAEFEREHANTPPKERPDWPLPSFDAKDWAEAFCKLVREGKDAADEAWLTTWFAGALMRGYDEHTARQAADIRSLKDKIDARLNNALCEMKPGYDDSITGFNEAWDIVRAALTPATGADHG